MILLSFKAGMRAIEIANLRWFATLPETAHSSSAACYGGQRVTAEFLAG